MKFKEELISDLIPRVEVLVKKEKSHLEFLKSEKDNVLNMSPIKRFFKGLTFYNFEMLNEMIDNSEYMLSHLTLRLNEYKQYASKLN
jgi:hypothetical protein